MAWSVTLLLARDESIWNIHGLIPLRPTIVVKWIWTGSKRI